MRIEYSNPLRVGDEVIFELNGINLKAKVVTGIFGYYLLFGKDAKECMDAYELIRNYFGFSMIHIAKALSKDKVAGYMFPEFKSIKDLQTFIEEL